MASDAHARLSGFLLLQSDRQPIRTVNGDDLATFDPSVVREFERDGLIVRLRDLRDADGTVFATGDGFALACSAADGEIARVSSLALQRWRIAFDAIAALMRRRLELVGPPIEKVDPRVSFLGASGVGKRRREVYLARGLRADQALAPLLNVRAHAGASTAVIVLALQKLELARSTIRQLDNIQIVALPTLLSTDEPAPFCVRLLPGASFGSQEPETARLVIDTGGQLATLDGSEVRVQRRDFATLTLLANEARNDGGFVSRDGFDAAIEKSTGRDANDERITASISRLRGALARIDPKIRIFVKRGVGYRLELPGSQISVL